MVPAVFDDKASAIDTQVYSITRQEQNSHSVSPPSQMSIIHMVKVVFRGS